MWNSDGTRRAFGEVVLFVMGLAVNFYIGVRVFQAIVYVVPGFSLVGFICVFTVIVMSYTIGRLPLPFKIKRPISVVGTTWLGASIYLMMFLLMARY